MTTQETTTQKRTLRGEIVSAKGNKTIVVRVNRSRRHKLYGKLYTRSQKFHVHDENNVYVGREGEEVDFVECRPISKTKKWRVLSAQQSEQSAA